MSDPALDQKPANFAAFWPHYLAAHSQPTCRTLHFVGLSGAVAGVVIAIATHAVGWAVAGIIFAYGLSWIGHFLVERNRPATFGHPLWSLLGDLRMYGLWVTGRLGAELARTPTMHAP